MVETPSICGLLALDKDPTNCLQDPLVRSFDHGSYRDVRISCEDPGPVHGPCTALALFGFVRTWRRSDYGPPNNKYGPRYRLSYIWGIDWCLVLGGTDYRAP